MIVIIIPSMLPRSFFILGCLLSVNSRDLPPRQQPAHKPVRHIRCASPGSWREKKEESELAKSWNKVNSLSFASDPHKYTPYTIWFCSVISSVTFAQCPYVLVPGGTLGIQTWRRGKKMTGSLLARAGFANHAAESDSFVHFPREVWTRHLCQTL